MATLSIRRQLQLMVVLVLLLLGLIWVSNSHFDGQTSAAEHTRQQLLGLERGLASLHINQQDFVTSKNVTHVEAFNRGADDYLQQLSTLRAQLDQLALSAAPVAALEQTLQAYRDSFQRLVSKQQEIGLDQQSGLYGALRQQARAMEQAVADDAELYAALLLLRRHEKDFMLRRNDAHYTRFMTALSDLRGKLIFSDMQMEQLAEIQSALRAYVQAFDALSQQEREIGLTESQGLHGDMAARISEAEQALALLGEQVAQAINGHMQTTRRASMLIIASSMLVMTLLLLWLARQLGRRLGSAAHSARTLAAGDWQKAIPCDRPDELGAVLQALDSMRIELVARSERIETDNRRRRHQAELAAVLQGVKTPTELAEQCIRYLTPALDCQVGALYLAGTDGLQFAAGYGVPSQQIRRRQFALGEGLPGQCGRDQQIMRIDNTPADYLPIRSATGSCTPATLLLAPAQWQGQLYAVLELATLTADNDLDDDELLASLGEMVAIALNASRVRSGSAEVVASPVIAPPAQAATRPLREASPA